MPTHKHLMHIVVKMTQDYEPFGREVRWHDPDRNYPDCSYGCRHYLPLEGELSTDWGVCSNPASHRCGLLTFEHQGCDKCQI